MKIQSKKILFSEVSADEAKNYAAEDADVALQLTHRLKKELEENIYGLDENIYLDEFDEEDLPEIENISPELSLQEDAIEQEAPKQ